MLSSGQVINKCNLAPRTDPMYDVVYPICIAMQLLQLKSFSMVLPLIVKKAIEKTGVQARTLRRDDKLYAPLCRRARAHIHARCMHACTLSAGLLLQYHLNFLHGSEDVSRVFYLFHVFFSREHMTLKANKIKDSSTWSMVVVRSTVLISRTTRPGLGTPSYHINWKHVRYVYAAQ